MICRVPFHKKEMEKKKKSERERTREETCENSEVEKERLFPTHQPVLRTVKCLEVN